MCTSLANISGLPVHKGLFENGLEKANGNRAQEFPRTRQRLPHLEWRSQVDVTLVVPTTVMFRVNLTQSSWKPKSCLSEEGVLRDWGGSCESTFFKLWEMFLLAGFKTLSCGFLVHNLLCMRARAHTHTHTHTLSSLTCFSQKKMITHNLSEVSWPHRIRHWSVPDLPRTRFPEVTAAVIASYLEAMQRVVLLNACFHKAGGWA